MKRSTAISFERVRLSRWGRVNPIAGLTPASLISTLNEFAIGSPRRAALLWTAILNRDGMVKTVATKRVKDPARFPWEIMTVDDSPRALEHAAALTWFYNNLRVVNAYDPSERGGFGLLVRQMLSAIGLGKAVHEIVLKPRRAGGTELPLGKDGAQTYRPDTLLTAEFRFAPLWWFENRNGPMAYLANDFDVFGTELKDGEWLVTCHDGLMEPCSVAYLYKTMVLQFGIGFLEKFGWPFIDAATDAPVDSDEWDALKEAVEAFMNDGALIRNSGASINLIESKAGTTGMFEPFIELMDRYITTVWRGGDLSTLSSKDGEGTGASVQGGESALLAEDDAGVVSETLNLQVDTFVIQYLFGEQPLAYLKIVPPQRANLDATIKGAEFLSRHKVPVGVSQLRERLGWPAPAEGEDLLAEAPPELGVPASAGAEGIPPKGGTPNDPALENALNNQPSTLDQRGRQQFRAALAADLQHLRSRLAAIADIEDETLFRERLAALRGDWDQIVKDALADPASAQVLADLNTAELFNGMDAARRERQATTAANP